VLLLADVKRRSKPVKKNASASLWDLGDGVLCLEFHTKMNALDEGVLTMLEKAHSLIDGDRWKALVLSNDAENFSVGANIGIALFAANIGLWPAIEMTVAMGQETFKRLKYAPFPTVGARTGMALGGGCEILSLLRRAGARRGYIGWSRSGRRIPGWGGTRS
jgi:3-hydroxyacyl-CoA dehydrogenase